MPTKLNLGAGSAYLLVMAFCSCAGAPARAPLPLAQKVDLTRFMSPWRVIAAIPASIEKNAYDAVESYSVTIIARSKRDYVRLVAMVKDWGYDTARMRKFPQPAP